MDLPGRRQPPDGRPGIYISFWAPRHVIDEIDALADVWGERRSGAIKRSISEAMDRTKDERRKFRRLKRKSS